MVRLNTVLMKNRTFFDSIRILVRGGKGGNGYPKYGGVGGKGGDVILEAVEKYSLANMKHKYPEQRFIAGRGADSKRFCILGNPGEDVKINCPTGISVLSDDQQFGDLDKTGHKLILAKGGDGGGPSNGYIGQKGQSFSVTLDLKLVADVGFVGFPNAGKSTLLKAISNAKPKIASYPFTTIEPKIGILQYSDFRKISVADLPGLITGAHLNFGMGHKFLKHCMRTKVLLFIIDIDGFQLNALTPHRTAFETIMFLNRELELFDMDLVHKPAILAINKIDMDADGQKYEKLKDQLKNYKENMGCIPKEYHPDVLVKFDAMLPISAKFVENVSDLKEKIRTIIDIYHEEKLVLPENESSQKENLLYA